MEIRCPFCDTLLTTIDEATQTCLVLELPDDVGVDFEPRITISGRPLRGNRHLCEQP